MKYVAIEGKIWGIAAIYANGGKPWAWLVNKHRPQEQVRMSCRHPSLQEVLK